MGRRTSSKDRLELPPSVEKCCGVSWYGDEIRPGQARSVESKDRDFGDNSMFAHLNLGFVAYAILKPPGSAQGGENDTELE